MKFSFDTIENFDEHINISVPNYNMLIQHVLDISTYFIKNDSLYYDLGCSTGALIRRLKEKHNDKDAQFIGVDEAVNLTSVYDDLKDNINNERLQGYNFHSCDFVTSIFTLQFLSIADRKVLLYDIYKKLNPGGAVIVAEKCFINDGFIQDLYTFCYYDYKKLNFSEQEIYNKQSDLRLIMRPMSADENELMFRTIGFKDFYIFWQSLNFKAWILIKK